MKQDQRQAREGEVRNAGHDWQAIACAMTAVAIWGWWMSATRVAAKEGVAPLDVALLRYAVPAILLLPIWFKTLNRLRHAPLWSLVAMLGWGAPFVWLVTASLQEAQVIYMAMIVPCTMPVLAVLAERVFFKHSPTRTQLLGFMLIGLAALMVLSNALLGESGVTTRSVGLMLLAAAGWTSYVVAFRHTGLTAAEGATYVCTASTLIILLVKLVTGTALLQMTSEQFVFNAVAQGFLSGFVAVILYTTAIQRLGPARAASFGVLMPVLGVLFAWFWLGETPSVLNLFALALGTAGVAIVNNVFGRTQ